MAKSFQKFLKKNIDLSPLGIEHGTENCAYFCTPKGASIIGWTGVDGIHYCFIRGFGEMVFAVSPESTPGNYVHPVATSFADFLRLLLTCGGEAALEQTYAWEQEQFDAFLLENHITKEKQKVLDAIQEKMKLAPIDAPYTYIRKIQAAFDYSKIRYTEDFYDLDMNPNADPEFPEWKVYFEGNFWGHRGRDRAGGEITIGKEFLWGGNRWLIPAVYSCSKGLVIDCCLRVPAKRIRAFMDKWNLSAENDDPGRFTRDQQMQIDVENPLNVDIYPEAIVNGTTLRTFRGCGVTWNPCCPEEAAQELEARAVVRHYGLDPADGWAISRWSLRWGTKRRPEIKSLSITLQQRPVAVPGVHFHTTASGDSFEFISPLTGQTHTLQIQEFEHQEMPERTFENMENLEFPTHCIAMTYTITPDLPDGMLMIQDCAECDQPRRKHCDPMEPENRMAVCCIGIIGGAHAPTVIMLGKDKEQGKPRVAYSSPHFEPVSDVDWQMIFYEKQLDDLRVEVL